MSSESITQNDGHSLDSISLSHFPDPYALKKRYIPASPFSHIVLDALFPERLLKAVVREISDSNVEAEKNFYGSFNKRKASDIEKMKPHTRRFVEFLNSAEFLTYIEALTGVRGLIADPYLEGGGIHQIGTGGFLKIHTDFNWHRRLKLHRRINLLVYLNDDWDENWNGHLELWDQSMSALGARIAPIFNRTVIFSTTDTSYHGHPDPLTCPSDVMRNSVAMYYYSTERPDDEIRFGASEMTNYRQRPNEKFLGNPVRHLIHQIQIEHPLLRNVIKLLKGSR